MFHIQIRKLPAGAQRNFPGSPYSRWNLNCPFEIIHSPLDLFPFPAHRYRLASPLSKPSWASFYKPHKQRCYNRSAPTLIQQLRNFFRSATFLSVVPRFDANQRTDGTIYMKMRVRARRSIGSVSLVSIGLTRLSDLFFRTSRVFR